MNESLQYFINPKYLGGQYKTEGRIKEPEVQGLIQAQGLALEEGGEERIFLSANLTVVETHRGSDVTLNCRVIRNTDYGTVSSNNRRVGAFYCHFVICCCR